MRKHTMLCISGFSGVGKDEFASVLKAEFGVIQTGLVDPAKRHMADIYGFSENQLFGPSSFRNAGDRRYPKPEYYDREVRTIDGKYYDGNGNEISEGDPKIWLSPREALQKYCELMNLLYGNTWIDKGIEVQKHIAKTGYGYHRMKGVVDTVVDHSESCTTMFADFRHKHEIKAAKALTDVRVHLVRIKSKRVPNPPFEHRSETEQTQINDDEFDFIINNDGTVEELHQTARHLMGLLANGHTRGTIYSHSS